MLPVVQMVFPLIYFSHSSEQPAPPLFDVAKKKKSLANPKHLFLGARLTCRLSVGSRHTNWSCSCKKGRGTWSCWSPWQPRPQSASLTSPSTPWRTRKSARKYWSDMYVCNPPPQGQGWLDEVVNNLRGVTGIHLQKLSDMNQQKAGQVQTPCGSLRKHLGDPKLSRPQVFSPVFSRASSRVLGSPQRSYHTGQPSMMESQVYTRLLSSELIDYLSLELEFHCLYTFEMDLMALYFLRIAW